MGWLDGLFGSGSSGTTDGGSGSSSDPLAKLDPKLREFLQKESPLKYRAQAEQQQPGQPDQPPIPPSRPTPQQDPAAAAAGPSSSSSSSSSSAAVPAESLYPDGRYADLWKTYRPLSAVEADTKSDHERLMDVLDAYKDRRAQIGRAALENCALEQLDWNTCIKTGPLSSRMTMCHAEMKKFERCYNVQSRLLKGLGYLSTYDRSREVDERVQLHADALYHRMLDQEAAVEQAKAEGRPAPALDLSMPISLVKQAAEAGAGAGAGAAAAAAAAGTAPPPGTTAAAAAPARPATTPDISEDLRKQWDERLAKLPAAERPSEEAALRAELQARAELSTRVVELRAAQTAERERRKAEGTATITDRVSGLFGR